MDSSECVSTEMRESQTSLKQKTLWVSLGLWAFGPFLKPFHRRSRRVRESVNGLGRFRDVEFSEIDDHGALFVGDDVGVPGAPEDLVREVLVARVHDLHGRVVEPDAMTAISTSCSAAWSGVRP